MCSYVAKRFPWRSSSMGRRRRMDGPSLINRTINQGPPILDLRLRWAVCPLALGPLFIGRLLYAFTQLPATTSQLSQNSKQEMIKTLMPTLYCIVLCPTHIYTIRYDTMFMFSISFQFLLLVVQISEADYQISENKRGAWWNYRLFLQISRL